MENLNIASNSGRAAVKAAWVESTRQQYQKRQEARAQAQAPRPADETVADAFKEARQGAPARRELIEQAFKGQQPKPEHFTSAQSGDPAEKLAAQFFPDLFTTAPQQPQETAAEPAGEAPPAPAPVAPPEAPAAPLPASTAELFRTIQDTVQTVTTAPQPSAEGEIRSAWRELGDSARAAVVAKIEAESYGLPGYLQTHNPDVLQRLVVSELAVRLHDARRLQDGFTVADLLKGMGAA